ncbi:MAG: transposase [Gemmatimonadaceae bacterium]|nr:transposase [Gemmatimonadaceae bacterium]
MARWPRLALPGVPLHITQRGNNRSTTFSDATDFLRYREFLLHASREERCEVHAYALMSNHVHLLVTPSDAHGVSRLMQQLGRVYVRYFNARYHRSGTLWEGRFKSALIDTSRYLLACTRYIDLNPVRAGITRSPEDYPWSSYGRLGLAHEDPVVMPHAAYVALGRTPTHRAREYRLLCGGPTVDDAEDRIRRATLGGSTVGSPAFDISCQTMLICSSPARWVRSDAIRCSSPLK